MQLESLVGRIFHKYPWIGIVALAAAYYLAGHWGLGLHAVAHLAAPIWVPTGLSLAALVLFGRKLWPGVLIGAFLVNVAHGASLALALAIAVGNTAEALLGQYLLQRLHFHPALDRLRDVFNLLGAAAILSTFLNATWGVFCMVVFHVISVSEYLLTWRVWWAGDMLSNIVVAPLLMATLSFQGPWKKASWRFCIEMAGLLFLMVFLTHIVFDTPFNPMQGKAALPYLVFPPLMWAAVRFGPSGAAVMMFLTSFMAVISTLNNLGPFGLRSSTENLFSLQLFISVVSVTSLIFAALSAERMQSRKEAEEASEALQRSHDELEGIVTHRTQELVQTNAQLRDSEERFRLLVEGVEEYAIFSLDPQGRVATWNSGAERLKGYQAWEIVGQPISRFYTSEDAAAGKSETLLNRARSEGRVRDEGWRVRKDGSRFFAEVLIISLRDKKGTVKGFAKVTRDITERRQMDDRLRRSREQLAEAQRIARLGSWQWDIAQQRLSCSDELCQILDWPAQGSRIHYSNVLRHIRRSDRPALKRAVRNCLKTRATFSIDLGMPGRGQDQRYLHVNGKPVENADGQIIRVIGTAQDVTDQKQSERALQLKEEELFQARKLEAIGRLAGGVAHDFNNLITGILGICQDLRETFSMNDPRRDEVEEVIKASNRAFDVTRQLLTFGRRQIISPKVIDVNGTVRDFVKLLHRLIGEDIKLDIQLSDDSHVKIDPGNLGQVLLNLVLNARDAMPHGGTLTIRTRNVLYSKSSDRNEPFVLLEVADTGNGMDDEILSHIFEPFFTTKSKDKGTGLGLATVYGIVKQNAGNIEVNSQEGEGTTFRVYLPRVMPAKLAEGNQVQPLQTVEGHETVLVVEDEDIVRRVVVKRLAHAGYKVLEAADGEHALEAFSQHGRSIDLIVTDVVMPEMNGREVVNRIHASHPDAAVLYMSGYPEEIIAYRGTLEPGINFLEKSLIQQDLLKKVREVLDISVHASKS